MFKIGFDIGGTFTDFVLEDTSTGNMTFLKTRSTPKHVEKAVIKGLNELTSKLDISVQSTSQIAHATTVATNAIIERKGTRTGLITTKGFRDILILGRQKRYDTYNLYLKKPEPLVKRRYIKEVNERISSNGQIIQPLDLPGLKEIIHEMIEDEIESIAVSLLHSYVNPIHEKQIKDYIHKFAPEMSVTLSSETSPKIREYERTSTTVADAYVKPIVTRYLKILENHLINEKFSGDFFIMQSNGGLASPELTRKHPVNIVESGPAAGVLMAERVGKEENLNNILTFDMGGTTAKLGAIDNGVPAITSNFEVDPITYDKGSGLPLNIPSIELLEIGAGGGSIATLDMGLIKVGPKSSGAYPGPICYGLGGEEVTVTDANLYLGYLNPNYFNAGTMKLDFEAAESSIRKKIAEPLGLSVGEAAWGIHKVANANMERAMRIVSIEEGRDPRNYALIAYGGAGPIHASGLAHSLNIPKVIVPNGAGVGSAIGLLTADKKVEASLTRMHLLKSSSDVIQEIYRQLYEQVITDINQLKNKTDSIKWTRYAYVRYKGQGHELKIDLPSGEIIKDYSTQIQEEFHKEYERIYGYQQTDNYIEVVDWHLVAVIPSKEKEENNDLQSNSQKRKVDISYRNAYFPSAGGFVKSKVVNRYNMTKGKPIIGPALIEERESTTLLPPEDQAYINERGHLIIEIKEDL